MKIIERIKSLKNRINLQEIKDIPSRLRKDKKLRKKTIIVLSAVAGVLILILAAIFAADMVRGAVNVYQVSDVAETEMWYSDDNTISGSISMDRMQAVYLNDSQDVTEVFVTEGQQVKKGDKLLTYDSTLSDIELERKEIEVKKKQLMVENLQTEISTGKPVESAYNDYTLDDYDDDVYDEMAAQSSKSYHLSFMTADLGDGNDGDDGSDDTGSDTGDGDDSEGTGDDDGGSSDDSGSEVPNPDDQSVVKGKTVKTYYVFKGKGTKKSPLLVQLADSYQFSTGMLDRLNLDTGKNYLILYTTKNDKTNTEVVSQIGILVNKEDKGSYTFGIFDGSDYEIGNQDKTDDNNKGSSDNGGDDPYYGDDDYRYTAEEIAEKKKELKNLKIETRLAEIELERLKNEKENDAVVATVDGTVDSVLDPTVAKAEGSAVVKISGGGGYQLSCAVNEYALENLEAGQEVEVTSQESGMTFVGTVESLGEEPTTSGDFWSSDPNVSFYPMVVSISSDAELNEYEYCTVVPDQSAKSEGVDGGFYIASYFVRSENHRSYVYIENEKGKLEKRYVKTGRVQWEETEIISGLSMDDHVAFPYGNAVREGAKTVEAEVDTLYE